MSEKETLIKMAAEVGARAALETLAKEKSKLIKDRYDKRLRNTRLLFKNYRNFKQHKLNAIYEISKSDENAIDILDLMWDPNSKSETVVKSIKQSVMRTSIIMDHIDEMLEIYKSICISSNKPEEMRKYNSLFSMYISDKKLTAEKIAKNENVDVRTTYKDISSAIEKMSALIFGVDFLN